MFGTVDEFVENRIAYRKRVNHVNPDPDWGDLGWLTESDSRMCGWWYNTLEWPWYEWLVENDPDFRSEYV